MCNGNTRRIWEENYLKKQFETIEEIFETTMKEFPQINVRHPTTDLGSSQNTSKDKCQINKQTTCMHIIFKLKKIKDKEKKPDY